VRASDPGRHAGPGAAVHRTVRHAVEVVALPAAHHVVDGEDDLLAVTHHGRVDERRERLRVVGRVPADEHDRVERPAVRGAQRHPPEVEQVEQVRVAELVRQGHGEDVEGPQRAVGLEREGRDAVLALQRLEVDPRGVGPLRERGRALVEHLVEDLDALVGLADLVGVGVAQQPPAVGGLPGGDDLVVLAADVLRGLADLRQQRLERVPVARRAGGAAPGTGGWRAARQGRAAG
jgi:hypothetical protein